MKALKVNGRLLKIGSAFLAVNDALPDVGGSPDSMTPNPFALGNTKARFVMQRAAGTYNDAIAGQAGSRTVRVPYEFVGAAPASVQARAVDFYSGEAVTGWATLVNNTIAGQTGAGDFENVLSGGWYRLQIRDPGQPTVVYSGDVPWGVGACILSVGQSNNIGLLAAGSYNDGIPGVSGKTELNYIIDPDSAHSVYGTAGSVIPQSLGGSGSDWATHTFNIANGGVLKFPRVVAKALQAKHGRRIPVAIIPCSVDGTPIEEFIPPNGGAVSGLFNGNGTSGQTFGLKSPSMGDFEIVQKHQGETGTKVRNTYFGLERDLVDGCIAHVATHGRAPEQLTYVPGVLGVYQNLLDIENVRAATLIDIVAYSEANNWANVVPFNCIDCDPVDGGDGLHFADGAGDKRYREWALCRAIQSVLFSMGLATFDGMGPKITTYTRASTVVTFEVANAQGSLILRKPGEPITGWYAHTRADFDDALGQSITITVAIVNNKIVITFPTGTFDSGKKAYVKHCGGKPGTMQSYHPNVSNLAGDSAQYPSAEPKFTRLPFQPTPEAREVA